MKLIWIISVVCLPLFVRAQFHEVYLDDSTYYSSDCGVMRLRDSLPDGHWTLYSISKKDIKKGVNKYCVETGSFLHSKKHGRFTSYGLCYVSKNSRGIPCIKSIEWYMGGQKDGYYVSFYAMDRKKEEGFYVKGRKEGIFLSYSREGWVEKANYYRNDTLLDNHYYPYKGRIYLAKTGEGNFLNGEFHIYDTSYNCTLKLFFSKNRLLRWTVYYPGSGIIRKISEGDFLQCSNVAIIPICDSIPFNGSVQSFGVTGVLLKTEVYQSSKLMKTVWFRKEE